MSPPKAVAVVGKSESGKTTLIEALIKLAKSNGLKVAAIKHAPHGAEIDKIGSDSDRFFKAGADAAAVITKAEVLLRMRKMADPKAILNFFKGYDLVIFEGFKKSALPKIEVTSNKRVQLKSSYKSVIARISPSKSLNKFHFAQAELKKLLTLIKKLP